MFINIFLMEYWNYENLMRSFGNLVIKNMFEYLPLVISHVCFEDTSLNRIFS